MKWNKRTPNFSITKMLQGCTSQERAWFEVGYVHAMSRVWPKYKALLDGEPVADEGEWWCPECREIVHPLSVTYQERHELCGCKVVAAPQPSREREALEHLEAHKGWLWYIHERDVDDFDNRGLVGWWYHPDEGQHRGPYASPVDAILSESGVGE